MFDRTYSCFRALCLLLTGFAATVGAILGESQKITFPAPRSTSNYARLETTLSQDLSSYTLCLHMRTNMSLSLDAGVVSYAVGHNNNELLLYKTSHGLHPYVHGAGVQTGDLSSWDGEWHAICATWRSSDGAWQVYTDGVLRASGSGLSVGNRVHSGGTWILAQHQDTVGGGFALSQAFSGELSQVNLWDRVLSPAEIGTDWSVFCSHHGNVIDWASTNIAVYGLASSERYLHCAILGESQKITFPAPRSTSNYARLETTLSHDLSSYTLCLHMRTNMSSSITIGLVSYAVEHRHDELLLYNRAGEGLNIYTHQNRVVITGNLPVWDGEWHAICATWRSSDGAWQVYTNGVRRDSGLGLSVGNRVDSGGTWILAQDQDTVGGSFDFHEAFIGELSQVNLWDRVLSPAEIGTDWSVFCSHHGNVIDWATTNISVYGLASSERHLHCEICPQCEHTCLYTNGDFQCSCYAGYALKENGTCDDIDECFTENGGCGHICSNTEGSFQCSCNAGYLLNDDGLACEDPCLTATPLYEPHRSTAHVTDGSSVCDGGLAEGWYRFTHVGGAMPTSCVESYRCGTESPIWLNGEHPTDVSIANRSACSNTGVPGDCCTEQYNIQVKRCPTPGQTYYVYKLVPTNFCEAYCAGSSVPCPNGEVYNVFHRTCGNIFPLFSDNPVLHPPEYDVSANLVTFTCEVEYDPDDVTAWFDVMFLFDDEYFPDVPNVTLTAGKRRAKMDASHLGLNQLYPHLPVTWPSKMGKAVSCQVRSYWEDTQDVKSEWRQSNSYWAGIQAEDVVVIEESADHYTLELTSTVPFVCRGGAQRAGQCYIDVPLAFDANDDDVCVAEGCRARFYADRWSDTEHRLKAEAILVAVKDGQWDGDKHMLINFGQITHTPVTFNIPHIFHGYTPQFNIQVRTVDSVEATCTYSGDPHGITFDELTGNWRKQIHVILPGEFVLYRSTKPGRKFEVHSRHRRCRWDFDISCNCGAAIREGNDVVIVDYCHRRSPMIRYKTATGGPLSPGVIVSQDRNGRYIRVTMPSGAFVEVIGSGFVTLRVHAPGIDMGYTEGLCGTFDGNPANDAMMPDGSISTHHIWPDWHRDFSYAWRIQPGRSLFDVECLDEVSSPVSESEFCTCGEGKRVECSPTKTRKSNNLNAVFNTLQPLQDARNRNCARRRKRDVDNIEDDPDLYNDDVDTSQYEFDYALDSEPVVNSMWPTPNRGITEEEARGKCQGGIMNLTIAEDCRDVYGVDIFSGVDFCMADVKVTEDFQYVDIIVQQIQAECAEKAYNNVSLYETNENGTAAPPAFIAENLCPRQCSNQGRCVNSTCECNEGYTSADCSIQIGRPPVALELPSDGLCDVRSRPCMKTSFFAEPVMDSDNLTCRITQVQIRDGIKTQANSSGRSEATFRSFAEVSCVLPRSPVRYGTPATNEGAVAHGMLLSVSNDGERFSEELFFTVYDSVCQECSQGGDCTWKPNTCIIRGHCFRDEEANPNDWCQQCLPGLSNTTWSDRPVNVAPRLTTPSAIRKLVGENLTLTLTAEDPEGRPVTFRLTSPGDHGVSVQPNGQLYWTTDDVSPTSINVTVEDECGASSEQTFHLTTMACPCENGGSCVPDPDMPRGQGFYTCVCPGYTGDVCETELDECQSDPCANGTCTDLVNGYNCTCAEGYIGTRCDVSVDNRCALDPCFPEVSCINLEDGGYSCGRCPSGYIGNGYECEDINECKSGTHGCLHGCNNLPGTYECTCPDGFVLIGDDCIDVDECSLELDDCSHSCTNTNGSYTCGCPVGYELNADGRTCDDMNECASSPCRNGGECQDGVNQYTCSCARGWVGTHCEEDVDECRLTNHGCHDCTNTPGSYVCNCTDGYVVGPGGTSCQDVNECLLHDAVCSYVCINTKGSYYCICPPGYTPETDECYTQPTDPPMQRSTAVSDDCRKTPCTVEHQECVENGGAYTCQCAIGYYFVVIGTQDKCRESLTYEAELTIDKIGGVKQNFTAGLRDTDSEVFMRTASVVKSALEDHFEASSLGGRYRGVKIMAFQAGSLIVRFDIYLSQGPASVSTVTGAFYGNLRENTFGSSQVTIVPSSLRVYEVDEDDPPSPWYNEPLYLALVCAGCAVTLTAIIVTLICCCAKHNSQQKKQYKVDVVHQTDLPLTERQLSGSSNQAFVERPLDW